MFNNFSFHFQVEAGEGLYLTLKGTFPLWIYLHDKEEEYFLHYDFWPDVPYIYKLNPQEYMIDFVVKKQLEIENNNCTHDQSKSFYGLYVVKIMDITHIYIYIYI